TKEPWSETVNAQNSRAIGAEGSLHMCCAELLFDRFHLPFKMGVEPGELDWPTRPLRGSGRENDRACHEVVHRGIINFTCEKPSCPIPIAIHLTCIHSFNQNLSVLCVQQLTFVR